MKISTKNNRMTILKKGIAVTITAAVAAATFQHIQQGQKPGRVLFAKLSDK